MNSANTFTGFNKLPFELRTLVWEMALPGPRCIECRIFNTTGKYKWKVEHSEKAPAILFTCQESRSIALKHYQAVLNENVDEKYNIHYLDPSKDIVFNRLLCSDGREYNYTSHEIANFDVVAFFSERIPRLSRLALSLYVTNIYLAESREDSFVRGLSRLPFLMELVVVPWLYQSELNCQGIYSLEVYDLHHESVNKNFGNLLQRKAGALEVNLMKKNGDDKCKSPKLLIGKYLVDGVVSRS